jgi:hypothetical protein
MNKVSIKMNQKGIIRVLDEKMKYFDICYWKERIKNPDSPDLANWKRRRRTEVQNRFKRFMF